MNNLCFHFTLGPVQGFVSQARRTRDFWAGSFLLSYLSAKAMHAVESAGGEIRFPDVVHDPLMQRLRNGRGTPNIGSVPNRFVAQVSGDFAGKTIVEAVQKEWRCIADEVWKSDLDGIANKGLWDSQIGSFWDISWAITADAGDSALLDRRKNWRTHYLPDHEQKGDKCTMMGEWQELSGVKAPGADGQKKFWEKARKNKGLDLREGERLCAIAYVKRRFVHVWQQLHPGWKLASGVPSVSYMAAVHWLEKLIEAGPDNSKITELCDAARKAHALGEKLTRIHCISTALRGSSLDGCIADIDGRLLFDNELRQLEESKKEKGGEITRLQAKTIRDARSALIVDIRKRQPDFQKEPSPFYAILFMDGDNLGKHMSDPEKQQPISTALGEFTGKVLNLVEGNNGFLVYAGGDDVLAILPLEDALGCALAVRQAYMDAFEKQDKVKEYSISAAIEFAHMKLPLTAILKDAHQLLDGVAKDGTGRDAIACRVWKPGGEQLTWALPWKEALDGGNLVMDQLSKGFRTDEAGNPGYASKVLYRIRDRLKLLGTGFDVEDIQSLLEAEYLTSGVLEGMKRAEKQTLAKSRISKLLPQCRKFGPNRKATGEYSGDAAIFLRFLAQKGVER